MLFEGRFYVAYDYYTEKNVIEWFCESDEFTSLVIIDEFLRIERYKEMREDYNCGVGWLTNTSQGDNRHEIFINEKFDKLVENFAVDNNAVVGFFRG
jgi:stage III sporulation protein SpoIIIAA